MDLAKNNEIGGYSVMNATQITRYSYDLIVLAL